jgi:hypothetical protein
MKRTISLEVEVEDEFLAGILTAGIEGGIGYWSVCHSYKWAADPDHPVAIISEDEEGENPDVKRELNNEVIFNGITKLLQSKEAMKTQKLLISAIKNNDAGEMDAGDSDVIIQMAIFGEVIYG